MRASGRVGGDKKIHAFETSTDARRNYPGSVTGVTEYGRCRCQSVL